ncbi:MAG TPA: hypothetical protein VFE15_10870 [Marmoricola sp.]|jgi:hypothetical protein|nr:hypothetical protein [Marmoricola sp.]
MSTSRNHPYEYAEQRSQTPAIWSVIVAVATTAAGFVIAAWSLAAASGVTRLSENDYSTEFIDPGISGLLFLLLVPIAVAAYLHLSGGLIGASGLTIAYVWAMAVCVQRYSESGWGSGLEVLGYVGPCFLGLMAFGIVGLARLAAYRTRARDRR